MATATRITRKPRRKPEPPPDLTPIVPPFPVRRFTVNEYHRMLQCGILMDREPFELIHGWIVPKMGINPPHSLALVALTEYLVTLRPPESNVRVQMPIGTRDSEPEPDVVIAVGSKTAYADRNPLPAEVLVPVEVSDSSLEYDQTTKLELYARAGIGTYWIVNLVDRRVEVYTDPRRGKKPVYKNCKKHEFMGEVPLVIGGKELGRIPVKELMM